ncbi:hypothetical protein Ancab_005057 [Ancistrocladus abbreviatus]
MYAIDVFNRFKDKDGNFKQELSRDIEGLMSMFEASQLSTEGEDILDEANEFSEKLLNASMKNLHPPLAMAIENALKHPYHKSLAMFTSEDFLNTYSDKRILNNELEELIAMEFNMWADLCNAFPVEERWFASGHVPRTKDYLKNGIVSSGVYMVPVHLFFLLGEGICQDAVDHLNDNPSIISNTTTILHLWDDLGSAKDSSTRSVETILPFLKVILLEHNGS